MSKFYVSISTTLSTDRVIEADTEEEAVEKARQLAWDDDDFSYVVIDSFNTDYEGYRTKYWEFKGCGEAPDDEEAYR